MQEKKFFFYEYKILNNISLLYIHKKNVFFNNTKYSIVFQFYIYARKKYIYFFYLHKIVNNYIKYV